MTNPKSKLSSYTITITGEGGEFALIPMTPEQLAYWREKGSEALVKHLTGGCEDDGTPTEFAFGYHYDNAGSTSGVHLEEGADLVVQDDAGEVCFEKHLDGDDFIRVDRVILHPEVGAAFETYEKGCETYQLELSMPFDPSKLCLAVTDYSTAYVLNQVLYDGEEPLQVEEMKPFGTPSVRLFG